MFQQLTRDYSALCVSVVLLQIESLRRHPCSLSGFLRTVVFSCDLHLGVLSRSGLVCNSLDNDGPGVLTPRVASITVGGFGVSSLDGWYDSPVSI